jgi:hypothetical protein
MDRSSVAPELHLLDEYEDENLLAYPWYIWCSLLLAERIVDLPRLGTAIRVAQTHRIDLGRGYCPHLSDAEYARWRQVWRAIIFIDTSVIPPNPLFAVLILLLQMACYRPWPKASSLWKNDTGSFHTGMSICPKIKGARLSLARIYGRTSANRCRSLKLTWQSSASW